MKGYIADLLLRLGHTKPAKPHLSLHKSKDIKYSTSTQLALEEDTPSQLDKDGITKVKIFMGALLWIGRIVNDKLLVAHSAIDPNKQRS